MRKDTNAYKEVHETLEERCSRHGNSKCEELDVGAMPDLFKRQQGGRCGWSRMKRGKVVDEAREMS